MFLGRAAAQNREFGEAELAALYRNDFGETRRWLANLDAPLMSMANKAI